MAFASPVVFGKAWIYVNSPSQNSWDSGYLGFNRDRGEIRFSALWDELKCDDHGGDAGPPADIQILGETAVVHCELTKWNDSVMSYVSTLISNGGLLGRPSVARGTLLFASGKAFQLLVWCQNKYWLFGNVVPRQPRMINPGTRFSTQEVIFDCYEDANGVLYTCVGDITAYGAFTTPTS